MSDSEVIYESGDDTDNTCSFEEIICLIHDSFEEPHQACMSQKLFWTHLIQMIEEQQEIPELLEPHFELLKTSLKRMANYLNLKVKQNCRQSFTDTMILVKKAKASYYKTSYSVELKKELEKWLTLYLPNWIPLHETCCLSLATTPTSTLSTTAATPVEVAGASGERKSAKRKILSFEESLQDSDDEELVNSHLPTGLVSSYISVRKDGVLRHRILKER